MISKLVPIAVTIFGVGEEVHRGPIFRYFGEVGSARSLNSVDVIEALLLKGYSTATGEASASKFAY